VTTPALSQWAEIEPGPTCGCGAPTTVRIMPDRLPWLMCFFHTKEAGGIRRLPLDKPACFQPCDPDCEAGPAHCEWIHEPKHRRGWHSQDDCPVWAAP